MKLTDKTIDLIGKLIGQQVRLVSAAILFGLWQHSWYAGSFAYCALLTLES